MWEVPPSRCEADAAASPYRGGRVAPPAADPSQATGRVNQLHRARVLEVRIHLPPAMSLRTIGSGAIAQRIHPQHRNPKRCEHGLTRELSGWVRSAVTHRPDQAASHQGRAVGAASAWRNRRFESVPSSGESAAHTDQAAAGREPWLSRGCALLGWRRRRQRSASPLFRPASSCWGKSGSATANGLAC